MPGAENYRSLLRGIYQERRTSSPGYSLRSFARDLKISPGRLSLILNNKQGLSIQRARELARNLNMSSERTEVFCLLVARSDSRSKLERQNAQKQLLSFDLQNFHKLRDDIFSTISRWQHFALHHLLQLRGAPTTMAGLARRLGIVEADCVAAIERLKRLSFVEEREGQLRALPIQFTTTCDIPSTAIRQYNKDLLTKAFESIESQGVDERDLSTLTVTVNEDDLPLFKQMIKEFRRKVDNEAKEMAARPKPRRDELYCLAVQFFRLSQKEAR